MRSFDTLFISLVPRRPVAALPVSTPTPDRRRHGAARSRRFLGAFIQSRQQVRRESSRYA